MNFDFGDKERNFRNRKEKGLGIEIGVTASIQWRVFVKEFLCTSRLRAHPGPYHFAFFSLIITIFYFVYKISFFNV